MALTVSNQQRTIARLIEASSIVRANMQICNQFVTRCMFCLRATGSYIAEGDYVGDQQELQAMKRM